MLEKSAKEIRDILATIRGAADVDFDALGKAPNLEITLNRTNLSKFNFHAAEVNAVINTALGGKTVVTGGRVREVSLATVRVGDADQPVIVIYRVRAR